ncbi:MAG: hypothetical protein WC521_01605 [Bdellovibrionales bacterium]
MQDLRIPKNSADVYSYAKEWEALYGDDFFFVTGNVKSLPDRPRLMDYSILGNTVFTLSDKVAVNPHISGFGLTQDQMARREIFFELREDGKQSGVPQDRFPTIADVRKQKESGKGVTLFSGGAEVFVRQEEERGPAYRWGLFARTESSTYGMLTGPNGLCSGPHTAEIEAVDEFTPVDVKSENESIVYGLVFDDRLQSLQTTKSVKHRQASVISKNLMAEGFSGKLKCGTLTTSPLTIKGLTVNRHAAICDGSGNYCSIDYGFLVFEHDQSTVNLRKIVGVTPPKDAVIHLTDGEYLSPGNRPGKLYDSDSLEVAVRDNGALSSLLALQEHLKKHESWPQPL